MQNAYPTIWWHFRFDIMHILLNIGSWWCAEGTSIHRHDDKVLSRCIKFLFLQSPRVGCTQVKVRRDEMSRVASVAFKTILATIWHEFRHTVVHGYTCVSIQPIACLTDFNQWPSMFVIGSSISDPWLIVLQSHVWLDTSHSRCLDAYRWSATTCHHID